MFKIVKPIFKYKTSQIIYIFNRQKGHSKWQNIRHIKAAKDAEKSALFILHTKKMRLAIAEGGGTNPAINTKLAKVIEQARKHDMPSETINNFLKKIQDQKQNSDLHMIALKGPNGSVILLHLFTDNMKRTIMEVNSMIKKHNVKVMDQVPKGMFEHKGIIITNFIKSLQNATDDAINCDAEDVEEINEDDLKYLQFVCDPNKLYAVKSGLEKCNYEIIKAEEQYIPLNFVDLNEEQEESFYKLLSKLEGHDEIVGLYNNLA